MKQPNRVLHPNSLAIRMISNRLPDNLWLYITHGTNRAPWTSFPLFEAFLHHTLSKAQRFLGVVENS